ADGVLPAKPHEVSRPRGARWPRRRLPRPDDPDQVSRRRPGVRLRIPRLASEAADALREAVEARDHALPEEPSLPVLLGEARAGQGAVRGGQSAAGAKASRAGTGQRPGVARAP